MRRRARLPLRFPRTQLPPGCDDLRRVPLAAGHWAPTTRPRAVADEVIEALHVEHAADASRGATLGRWPLAVSIITVSIIMV